MERALDRGIDPDKAWQREGFAEEELKGPLSRHPSAARAVAGQTTAPVGA